VAHGIERRLKWDLFGFIVVSSEYYEDLTRYCPRDRDYQPRIKAHLKDGWKISRQGVWYNVLLSEDQLPDQGFKIHISATSRTAGEVMQRVIPICLEKQTAFKALIDGFILDFTNSKNYARASSGKFMTIYPKSQQECGDLLEELQEATTGLDGPYVLSDARFADSKVVFYRYGGFRQRFQLNIFGEIVPMMLDTEGNLIPDRRFPYFQLPDGIEDPFKTDDEEEAGSPQLAGRYTIGSALRFSNSGGVYLGEDAQTVQRVVIKEARPFVNQTERNADDAITTLKKEAEVLKRMQVTPYVPRFIDLFQEWEHQFLVEEYIEGIALSSFRALEGIGLLIKRTVTQEDVIEFCQRFAEVAGRLLEAVLEFHKQGIIIGDLSPSNIIIDVDTLDLKLIDFEGALFPENQDSFKDTTITTGFVSPQRLAGNAATYEDDLFSLGSVLYSLVIPVQEYFPLNPEAERRFYDSVALDYDLPPEVGELIFSLRDRDLEAAHTALIALSSDELGEREWSPQLEGPPRATEQEAFEIIKGVQQYILGTADLERTDRLWPADCRIFMTNPLSVAYGALGTALFLKAATGNLPEPFLQWILDRPISDESYPPGLFAGLAGVAWALSELGQTKRAAEAIELAHSSPLRNESADIFYGEAGIGLASLYFWHKTGDSLYLDKARESAEMIAEMARHDDEDGPEGPYWINVDGGHYYGYAHGNAGIAFFLLRLYQATKDSHHLEQATAALEYEIANGIYEDDYAVWLRSKKDALRGAYWRYGAAGVGSVLIRFYEALGDDRYLDIAKKAARYASAKYAVLPTQLIGLSGMGEFLVDMYHFTGDESYLQDAWRLVDGIMLYQIPRPQGIAFPGEELLRISTDFGTGSAGIAMFLMRLLRPGDRLFYELEPAAVEPILE
jgi:serine/threonine protein kinase